MSITAAIEALWHMYHYRLTVYFRRRVNPDRVDDMVQQVYLHALEAMHKGIGANTHASGWIHRIAHNMIVDYYRARERQPEMLDIDDTVGAGELRMEIPTLDEHIETVEAVEQVQWSIGYLSSEQAAVVRGRLEGYRYDELAQQLGKTEGAVKSLQTRALANMQIMLSSWWGSPPRLVRGTRVTDPRDTQSARLRNLLLQHGPMTLREMAERTGFNKGSISRALSRSRDFQRVGYRVSTRTGKTSVAVWGVAGVHNQEAARGNRRGGAIPHP